MRLSALIFDVDGTLAETEEAHRAAFNRAFEDWGLGWHWGRETYRELLRTAGGKERLRVFQDSLPAETRLGADEIARLHADKTAIYGDILNIGGLDLRPGVAGLIAAARAEGLRLAVATTTSRANVAALVRCCWGAAPEAVFDVIAAGDEVAAKKPAPDVYLLALARLGLPPRACIAVEDSAIGLRAALAAGLRVMVTPSAYTQGEDFTGAALVADSLTGLTPLRLAGIGGDLA